MKITLVVVVYRFNFEGLLELNAEACRTGEACRTDLDRRGTSRTLPGDFRRPMMMTTYPTFIIQNYII